MSYSVCCMTSQLQTDLENLEMTDTNYTAIMNFRKQLVELYSSYRSKKRLFKLLRGLQIAGGFMITTLTTYNNPYFKENSESIGISFVLIQSIISANDLFLSHPRPRNWPHVLRQGNW